MDTVEIKQTIDQVITDSENSVLSIAEGAEQNVIDASMTFIDGLKTRGVDYINVITDDSEEGKKVDKLAFLKESLKIEEKIFQNELIAYAVIGKQVAQDIINSLSGILVKAILSVLPATP